MNNMILGRYIPGNSIIHQLDPREVALNVFVHFLLFWANNLQKISCSLASSLF